MLSHTNALNRKLEEVDGVGKEFNTVAELWSSFLGIVNDKAVSWPYSFGKLTPRTNHTKQLFLAPELPTLAPARSDKPTHTCPSNLYITPTVVVVVDSPGEGEAGYPAVVAAAHPAAAEAGLSLSPSPSCCRTPPGAHH